MDWEQKNHLVVFVHGLEGSERTLRFLKATVIEKTDDEENLVCYTATSNIGKTNDGIENGGRRLAQEVEAQMHKIKGPIALSFVGHSCGGLYARHALDHLNWTDRVTPRVFSTIATPHLGVGKDSWPQRIFKKTAAKLLPATIVTATYAKYTNWTALADGICRTMEDVCPEFWTANGFSTLLAAAICMQGLAVQSPETHCPHLSYIPMKDQHSKVKCSESYDYSVEVLFAPKDMNLFERAA